MFLEKFLFLFSAFVKIVKSEYWFIIEQKYKQH